MKLSFSTIGCPGWTWKEIFATAKDLGMNGIEIRGVRHEIDASKVKAFDDDHYIETKERLEAANMELPILTSGSALGYKGEGEFYYDEAIRYIDMAHKMGAKAIRVMLTKDAYSDKSDIAQAKDLYKKLCQYAIDKDVYVLMETAAEFADTKLLKEFMADIDYPTCGVLWDIHHPFRFCNESPQESFNNIGKYVKHVHVKDSVIENGKVCYRMMGYGDVPVLDCLRILKANDYQDYVSLEWLKRWCPDLQEPGIVFSHYATYMHYLLNQI